MGDFEESGERLQLDASHLDELMAVRFTAGRLGASQQGIVETHLAECGPCRELVARAVNWSNSTRDREAGPEWRGSLLRAGVRLAARYRIEKFVARGGMGEVYEAYDEALGEHIAIKTVTSHYAGDSEAIAQLKAEVQLARKIGHRNVCRIYDLEQHHHDDGPPLFFLKMEFIDGPSLGQRLKGEHSLIESEARHVAIGILEGLQAAHEAGVLHRDLKTDNVMFRTDREGRLAPVLMDFGLASALNPNSSRVSGDHALVGSLSYMAPEQVQGDALRPATDLYAVGVILFEMLTGRLPFVAATPALAAIMRVQNDAPRLRELDPSLPEDLERIVARCLARDPKDRYRSAKEMLAELSPEANYNASTVAEATARVAAAMGEAEDLQAPPPRSADELSIGEVPILPSTPKRSNTVQALRLGIGVAVVGVTVGVVAFGLLRTPTTPNGTPSATQHSRAPAAITAEAREKAATERQRIQQANARTDRPLAPSPTDRQSADHAGLPDNTIVSGLRDTMGQELGTSTAQNLPVSAAETPVGGSATSGRQTTRTAGNIRQANQTPPRPEPKTYPVRESKRQRELDTSPSTQPSTRVVDRDDPIVEKRARACEDLLCPGAQ